MADDSELNLPVVIDVETNDEFIDLLGAYIPAERVMPKVTSDDVLIERFLTKRNGVQLDDKSYKAYSQDIAMFRAWLVKYVSDFGVYIRPDQNVPLGAVNGIVFEDYVKEIQSKYRGGTIRRRINIIRSLYKYGNALGYFQGNPTLLVQSQRDQQAKSDYQQTRILKKQDVLALRAAAAKNLTHQIIITLLLATGMRVSEFTHARWCDIKIQEERVGDAVVPFKYLYILGKGKKRRKAKIVDSVWEQLVEYRKSRNMPYEINEMDASYIVGNRFGGKYSERGVTKILSELGKRANLPYRISAHWLRHTCASFALLGGASLTQVQELLGHSSLRITEIYLHSTSGLEDTAIDHLPQELLTPFGSFGAE